MPRICSTSTGTRIRVHRAGALAALMLLAEYDAWVARLRAECEAKRPFWQRIAGGA